MGHILLPSTLPSASICVFASVWWWCHFHFSHSNTCMRMHRFGFGLNFPNGLWCWTSFHVLVICAYPLNWHVYSWFFTPFLNEVLIYFFSSWVWHLYISSIQTLHQTCSFQIFSHIQLVFSSFSLGLFESEIFYFAEVQFIILFLFWVTLLILSLRALCIVLDTESFLFLLKFYCFVYYM